ncbi:hypothetical protein [Microbacterium gilvum]|uniref:Uncharacterized protein n=1 Tax=Microbacterium gilvum TaxID=1336204 RepID=A0ABP9A987_9MICO
MPSLPLRALSLLGGAVLALGLAVPASATTPDESDAPQVSTSTAASTAFFDVTKLTASSIVVGPTTDGCTYVPVTISRKLPVGVQYWDAFVDVTRNGQLISTAFFGSTGSSTKSRFLYCPLDGFGKFTLGPTEWYAGTTGTHRSGLDGTKGYFYVRSRTKAGISSITRTNGVTTVKVSATRFAPYSYPEQVKFSAPQAQLQVRNGTTWKTVATVKLVNGSATLSYRTSAGRTYRVVIPQTDSTTAAVTPSKTK